MIALLFYFIFLYKRADEPICELEVLIPPFDGPPAEPKDGIAGEGNDDAGEAEDGDEAEFEDVEVGGGRGEDVMERGPWGGVARFVV